MIEKLLGMPINAAAHGPQIDFVIFLVHVLMLILFVGWGAYFIYVLFRFKRSANPKADYHGLQTHVSSYVEIGVAIAEVILLVCFSIPMWARLVNALPDEKSATVVRVVAEQFAWNIHYPGADGVFGKTDSKLVNQQTNPIGLDKTDPNAQDDVVTLNQLHLPINKTALIHLTAKDVIHCFALPVMRVRQDVIPGMSIPTWFTPIKTGKFEIACAQLCGLGHYRMRGYLTIETPEEFQNWLLSQPTIKASGSKPGDDFWN